MSTDHLPILANVGDVKGLIKSRGTINTPMVDAIEATTTRERHGDIPINRKGQPEEVGALIAFLLGDESRFITGSVHSIDGGWTI